MLQNEQNPPPLVLSAKQEKTLFWLDKTADLLDNRFRIPGTQIRFGFDFLIGLIPYAGDMIGLAVSGLLILVMARNGASGMVGLKMAGNILLDAMVGVFPIIGDLFDLRYKANTRNVRLLQQHYHEGKHQGSAIWAILLILLALVVVFFLMAYVIWQLFSWVFQGLFGV
ncbi:MAG: DUF4112 domain-containing protein [Saprospiraceae bacterium]|nr:DUF4112 domain-containing protein [Saprospiraceae bacterium]